MKNKATDKLDKYTEDQLRDLIVDARGELKRRVIADDPFKAIKGQECCKRALTVAAVQGHLVIVYGPHGSGKSMLVDAGRAIGVPVIEQMPCPCGNFTDPRLSCKCTSNAIERHSRKRVAEGLHAEIHVECPAVPASEMLSKRHGTAIACVKDQLSQAGGLPSTKLRDDACNVVLKDAITEFGLSGRTVEAVLSVAQSIAALAQRDAIDVTDILEAVHYRRLDRLTG